MYDRKQLTPVRDGSLRLSLKTVAWIIVQPLGCLLPRV